MVMGVMFLLGASVACMLTLRGVSRGLRIASIWVDRLFMNLATRPVLITFVWAVVSRRRWVGLWTAVSLYNRGRIIADGRLRMIQEVWLNRTGVGLVR